MKLFLFLLAAVASVGTLARAQVPTLHDRVRQLGSLTSELRVDYPVPDFATLVADADTVVVGTVRQGTPVLTHQDSLLETDYQIAVEQVIRQNPRVPLSAGNTLIVRRPGGVTTLYGRPVIISDPDFPPFVSGERYALLLTNQEGEPYPMLRYGGQDAFLVGADQTVRQASLARGNWNNQRGAVTLSAFIEEVRSVIPTVAK